MSYQFCKSTYWHPHVGFFCTFENTTKCLATSNLMNTIIQVTAVRHEY